MSDPELTTLVRDSGAEVDLINVGAGIADIRLPVAEGAMSVVVGYASLAEYLTDQFAMGSTVGRFANRIANGKFEIDGREYQLDVDPNTGHCLHGGPHGFHTRIWTLTESTQDAAEFRLRSPDGDAGFPGDLDVSVRYRLIEPCSLQIDYAATVDRPTIVNLTNHAYFNLHGTRDNVGGHLLNVEAAHYTPVDDELIPTGQIASVNGTALDFQTPRTIGNDTRIDHNFVVAGYDGTLRKVAQLSSPKSGVSLIVRATQPGLQVYTGHGLTAPFQAGAAICLEPQLFPDAPNHAAFPSTILRPGHTWRSQIRYDFRLP